MRLRRGAAYVYVDGKRLDEPYIENDRRDIGPAGDVPRARGPLLRHGRQPLAVVRLARLGLGPAQQHHRQGLHDLLAASANFLSLTCRVGPRALLSYEHRHREPRAAQYAHGPASVQGGRHAACPLQGDRGQQAAHPGVRGDRASSARAPASARPSRFASSPSASASSGRSRSTRRRSRSSRSPRSATSGAPSSTTSAREWGRRRASASSDRASVYPRPRGSFQRPASPRVRPQARRALRRGRRRGRSRVARRPARRRRRALRLRGASAAHASGRSRR